MKKIRRWLLAFAVIITMMVQVDGLKATSLIFGRGPATSSTSTTSSTTTAATSTTTNTTAEEASEEVESDDQGEEVVTRAPLTGIPQVDYVWDPNLPRELRGANLSDYPFLDSVPVEDEIGFTCDPKLHDGFYASIKYNCQLYHHCINGMRYDFLCANYTRFDQKTFICHFASEVDCKNSPKYWYRNDVLYKATTTTTQKPAPTLPTTAAPTTVPTRAKPLRKPVRRRRPQVEYYYDDDEEYEDEYYEERPRRRKNRPRNRRPVYEDDYEDDDRRPADRYRERERDRDRDVDEEDYDDRRPYRSKNRNRNNDRRTGDDERRPGYQDERRRKPVEDERRRPLDDDRRVPVEDEKRSSLNDRRKRPVADDRRVPERRPITDDRRPLNEDRRQLSDERRSVNEDRRPLNEDRRPLNEDRRPLNEDRRSFSGDDRRKPQSDRSGARRPYNDDRRFDYDDEEEDYSPRRPEKKSKPDPNVVTVKPSGSTIYDRPRAAPRINRPVPLNEKNKFSYVNPEPSPKKSSTTPVPVNESDPEYYDEYEDEPKKPAPIVVDKRKSTDSTVRGRVTYNEDKRQSASSDVVYYDDVIVPKDSLPQKPVPGNVKKPDGVERVNSRDNSELANRYNEKIRTPQRVSKPEYAKPEYVDDEPAEQPKPKQQNAPRPSTNIYNNFKNKKQQTPIESRKPAPVQSIRDYEVINKPAEVPRPILRSTKRPFLPSRGGNPYAARGLQPVGVAKQPQSQQQPQQRPSPSNNDSERPAPFRIDVDGSPPSSIQLDTRTSTNRPNEERVKTLDQLYDEEFDVTLNDALNPTLKPLTRSAPQSFFRNRYIQQSSDSEFMPFEPNYAPSEFRRATLRPPQALVQQQQHHPHQPTVFVSQSRGHQRYEYEYEY